MNALTLLIKPISGLCNLSCRYCFYKDELRLREAPLHSCMSRETALRLAQAATDFIGTGGHLSLCFQGGEPTLVDVSFYDFFLGTIDSMLPKDATVSLSLQTNGYALSEELLCLLKDRSFLIGISLDGNQRIHETYRGAGTWNPVVENAKRLQLVGLPCNVLCVVTKDVAKRPRQIYENLKALGFSYQQYIPCLAPIKETSLTETSIREIQSEPSYASSPKDYCSFLCGLFDAWYTDWKKGDYVDIRFFEDLVYNALNLPSPSCSSSGSCGNYLVIEADGTVYPCDFYSLDAHKLGNIHTHSIKELFSSPKMREFQSLRLHAPKACLSCPWKRLCHSGCMRDWVWENGELNHPYCEAYQNFFSYSYSRLMEIVAAERSLL